MSRSRLWLLAAVSGGAIMLLAFDRGPRAATADGQPAPDGEYGTITGQFLLEGDIPRLPPLVEKGNTKVNDPAICAAADIPDDSLVVDPKTNGIANIFVYLPKAGKVHPRLKASEKKEVVFDQKGCRFIPHALVVRTDQVVRVKSGDNCTHNTKTNPLRNQAVNFALQANDRAGVEVKNKAPERYPIEVQCNVHNWMTARWLVLDHPYGTVSDEQGKFTIADLPAGEHELVIWQERVGLIDKKYKVNVVAGKTTDVGTIPVPAARLMEKK
ncbi:MAG: hypothetical protein ACM3U2_24190 [Deltaproteobacteria bacterium]